MTDETQSLKPGEIIHNGEVKNATCSTCPYLDSGDDDEFWCNHTSQTRPSKPMDFELEYFCDKHPLRDPQVRIAEALEKLARLVCSDDTLNVWTREFSE